MIIRSISTALVAFPRFGGMIFRHRGRPMARSHSPRRARLSNIFVSTDREEIRAALPTTKGRCFPDMEPQDRGQIAFVSGRTGLPQIYTMEADGTNLQRVTDQGYAVSPNWSPNGQFLTFSWMRKYGPGEPGSKRYLLMDAASKMGATYPRRGAQRFSLLVSRRPAHRVSVSPLGSGPDLDHAGRWHKREAIDLQGRNTQPTGVGSRNVFERTACGWPRVRSTAKTVNSTPQRRRTRNWRFLVKHATVTTTMRWGAALFALATIMFLAACAPKKTRCATAATAPQRDRTHGFGCRPIPTRSIRASRPR